MPNYFGYGAYRDQNWIEQVVGHEVMGGRGGLIQGYQLGYQLLTEIPQPARKILESVWGGDYRCYSLKVSPESSVIGRLWSVSEADLIKIKEWEFVGSWKELIQVEVKQSHGAVVQAYTDKILAKFLLHGTCDGFYYQDLINERTLNLSHEDEVNRQREINRLRQRFSAMRQYLNQLKQANVSS